MNERIITGRQPADELPLVSPQVLGLLVLAVAVVASAITVVVQAQSSRHLFADLESLRKQRYELDIQWSRLMLERSTLLSHDSVERIARQRFDMVLPTPEQVVVVHE
jgi:cell division protein FtsL